MWSTPNQIIRRSTLKNATLFTSIAAILFLQTACAPSKDSLKKLIEENPDIVFSTIEKNPKAFIDTVNKAAKQAQVEAQKQKEEEEKVQFEEEFANPKVPVIDEKRVIFGNMKAPITIVEYSDFECPYCTRGYNTIKQVMQEYGDKVRVIYKHLPLDFHPLAEPAAKYYEAISLQDHAKAQKFHDMIFDNQGELKSDKEKFLDKAATKVGANLAKLKKDLDSDVVKQRIASDIEEARKFEFSGTPGFLINGVSLKGAYPFPEFKKIIDRHLAKAGQ
jgi:protein-disulfide isomerase